MWRSNGTFKRQVGAPNAKGSWKSHEIPKFLQLTGWLPMLWLGTQIHIVLGVYPNLFYPFLLHITKCLMIKSLFQITLDPKVLDQKPIHFLHNSASCKSSSNLFNLLVLFRNEGMNDMNGIIIHHSSHIPIKKNKLLLAPARPCASISSKSSPWPRRPIAAPMAARARQGCMKLGEIWWIAINILMVIVMVIII